MYLARDDKVGHSWAQNCKKENLDALVERWGAKGKKMGELERQ
ncbi:MAG: hypothetical protein ACOX7N_01640 [Lawsonibacter sp.]